MLCLSKLYQVHHFSSRTKFKQDCQYKQYILYMIIYFLSPGYDLVQWLRKRFDMEEQKEAIHLSQLLCQYGYIYPLDLKSYSIKEDRSVEYRFQVHYINISLILLSAQLKAETGLKNLSKKLCLSLHPKEKDFIRTTL